MAKYQHQGTVQIFKREQESNWWVWVVGGVALLALLSQCTG